MTYKLIFDSKAINQLEKLSKEIRLRIFRKVQLSKPDPHHFFNRLEGRKEYKLRVGDYRVIADILDKEIQILVMYVAHRKKVYKKL